MHTDQAAKLRQLVVESKDASIKRPVAEAQKHAKIIAVASGKGGVGKTNLSVNLAIELSRKGKKTALVDLDLGLANVDILLNLTTPFTLEHVVLGFKKIEDIIVRGPEGLSIVPGGSGLPALAELTDSQRSSFIENFYRLAAEYDVIILDTAAGISENVLRFAMAADEVLVVTTEEPTAVTDAYALMKVLSTRNKAIKMNMAFNMVRNRSHTNKSFTNIRRVVKQFLGIEVGLTGMIDYDSAVNHAIMKRRPFVLQYPFSGASKSLRAVAKEIIRNVDSRDKKNKTLLQKLTKLFSH